MSDYRLASNIQRFIERMQKEQPFEQIWPASSAMLWEWQRLAAEMEASKMAPIQLCENCDYFSPNTSTLQNGHGECRRNPPNSKGIFPPMWKHDWCGLHRWKFTKRSETANERTAHPEPSPSASIQTCKHERLNEDGVCRTCGTDQSGIQS